MSYTYVTTYCSQTQTTSFNFWWFQHNNITYAQDDVVPRGFEMETQQQSKFIVNFVLVVHIRSEIILCNNKPPKLVLAISK